MSKTTEPAHPMQSDPMKSEDGAAKRPLGRFFPAILIVLLVGAAILGSFYVYWPGKHEVKRVFYIVQDIQAIAATQGGYQGLTPAKMAELGVGKQIGHPVWTNQWGGAIEVKPVHQGARFQLVDTHLPPRACMDLAVIDTPYHRGKLKHPAHEAPFAVWINGSLLRAWGGELNKWALTRACDHPSNTVTLEMK